MKRGTVRLAWVLEGICLILAIPALLLLALDARMSTPADDAGFGGLGGLTWLGASLAFTTVGALVASRVRGNRVGWILGTMGLLLGLGVLAFQWADYALFVAATPLPGGRFAAWAANVALTPTFGFLGVCLLLFPDGRLPSRRWRAALAVATIGIACIVVGYALRPGPLDEPFETVTNPYGLRGTFELMDNVAVVGWLCMAGGVAIAAVALTRRLRRSRGHERQQLKWIALAGAVAGLVVVADFASYMADVQGIGRVRDASLGVAYALFPVAAGVAILRHRLYDIDVVINRALVYGALTATLGGAYLGVVLLIGLALGRSSDLAIAASTLAVAALFRPARARIQGAVDRRFYRHRYDAAQTLEAFGARLRDEVDLKTLGGDLAGAVRETVQPAHLSLWLRTERT